MALTIPWLDQSACGRWESTSAALDLASRFIRNRGIGTSSAGGSWLCLVFQDNGFNLGMGFVQVDFKIWTQHDTALNQGTGTKLQLAVPT